MNLALMGFGTVGTGVEEILFKKKDFLSQKGIDINIKKVLIANANKKRYPKDDSVEFTDNFDEILNSDVDTVIDVTSNLEETYKRIIKLMNAGKNIITANKAVVSKYFEELNETARKNDVYFSYEASVGGAIPIIHPLMEELQFNEINSVSGILNGTSNFILSEMEEKGLDYDVVLKKAQDLGYAEADPTADVCGFDSQRKIRILSSLSYNAKIKEEEILTLGISNIKKSNIEFSKNNNYNIRLIANSQLKDEKIYITVMPMLVKDPFFSNTIKSLNKVRVTGEYFGEYRFFGAGAGKLETADAVIRDLLRIFKDSEIKPFYTAEKNYKVSTDLENKYYISVREVKDALYKVINKDETNDLHHIITKNLNFDELKDILNSYDEDEIFVAAVEEEKWNFYQLEIKT